MAPGTVNNSPYNIPVHTGYLQEIHYHFTNTTRRESLMKKLQSQLESFQSYPQHHSWNREPRITSRAEIFTVWIAPLFIESKQRYSPYPPLQENTMADGSANRGRSPVRGFVRLSFQRFSRNLKNSTEFMCCLPGIWSATRARGLLFYFVFW